MFGLSIWIPGSFFFAVDLSLFCGIIFVPIRAGLVVFVAIAKCENGKFVSDLTPFLKSRGVSNCIRIMVLSGDLASPLIRGRSSF